MDIHCLSLSLGLSEENRHEERTAGLLVPKSKGKVPPVRPMHVTTELFISFEVPKLIGT